MSRSKPFQSQQTPKGSDPEQQETAAKIGRVREDLQEVKGGLQKLRTTIKQGIEDIHEAIYDNIEAQAELQLMQNLAEARSIPQQIDAEEEQIEIEREELESELQNLSARYEEKHEELNQRAEKRVRNLGEHIFEIQEDEFEGGVEDPFTEHVTATWQELREHADQALHERTTVLRDGLANAHNAIDGFIERRRELLDRIEQYRVETGGIDRGDVTVADADGFATLDESVPIQVPFWVVTYEVGSREKREIVGPAWLKESTMTEWFGATTEEIPGFADRIEALGEQEIGPAEHRSVSTNELRDAVAPYASAQSIGLTSVQFTDEFEAALDEDLDLIVEGREGETISAEEGDVDASAGVENVASTAEAEIRVEADADSDSDVSADGMGRGPGYSEAQSRSRHANSADTDPETDEDRGADS